MRHIAAAVIAVVFLKYVHLLYVEYGLWGGVKHLALIMVIAWAIVSLLDGDRR